ncbi:MAG: hypothetical protein WDM77_04380 [Steroidobacteraceae bacterium]
MPFVIYLDAAILPVDEIPELWDPVCQLEQRVSFKQRVIRQSMVEQKVLAVELSLILGTGRKQRVASGQRDRFNGGASNLAPGVMIFRL